MRGNKSLGASYFDEEITRIDQAAVTGTWTYKRRVLHLLARTMHYW